MKTPLDPPGRDSETLRLYLSHFGVSPDQPRELLLQEIASAFSRLPYENLTKVLKFERESSAERARRWPAEVVSEHISLGTGGTCFSLTAALLHLLRAAGLRAEPILADRHYGPDTHCALLVDLDGAPHLLDPGYLIVKPIPLAGSGEKRLATEFNEVILTPRSGGDRLDLTTVQDGSLTWRLTYKTSPVDAGRFLKVWDSSFGWDMMAYPLLTRVAGRRQVFLNGNRLQVRGRGTIERSEIAEGDLAERIGREFGIDPSVASRAFQVLARR